MALTTISANLVRQKTYMINRNSGVFYALKALFLHLAANKGNPDLFLKNIDGLVNSSDGGNSNDQVMVDAACTLYAIYIKKTGSTATFFKVTNHAATGTTDGTQDLGYKLTTSLEEDLLLFPSGRAFSAGIVVSADTTATGATATLKANRIDGFVIVSA
jgi:hypothetical protein